MYVHNQFIMIRKLTLKFSTVNKQEMDLFQKLSNWWHPSGPMQVLYAYNYHRVQFLKKHIITTQQASRFPFQGLKALDVGCGAGFLSESMARLGANVTGLDPNPTSYSEALAHKQKNCRLPHLQYFNQSVQDFIESKSQNPQDRLFDIVTSMQVIEHVDNPQQFLNSLSTCIKPNGLIMLSTIQRSISTWLTHIMVAENILGIVPAGTHHHQKFINRNQLQTMMNKCNIEPIDSLELDLNWKGQFIPTANGGNYLVIGKKINRNKSDETQI